MTTLYLNHEIWADIIFFVFIHVCIIYVYIYADLLSIVYIV